MSPIDQKLITRKIGLIEKDLARIKEHGKISYAEYLKNEDVQLVIERLLERIISRMIDINYHILKEEFGLMPEGYFDSFTMLGKKGVLSEEFANQIARSAGLRNALAHEYDEIDHKSVHASIGTSLQDVPVYLKDVMKFIN